MTSSDFHRYILSRITGFCVEASDAQWASDGQKSSARLQRHGQKLEADARAHKLGMRVFKPDFRRLIDVILVEKLRDR